MKRVAMFCILPVLLAAFSTAAIEADEPPIRTFVSILPQSYFVERIGGDNVIVEVLVDPGKSPHTFEPTPRQMIALGEADLYFGIGFPFEQRVLAKVQSANPTFRLIHTDRGVIKRPLDAPHSDEHGGEGHHNENGAEVFDPHIWLSKPEIMVQAENIYDALVSFDPSHRDTYKNNLTLFMNELDRIDLKLRRTFEPYRERPFFVYHPAFGYFADTYGLVQVSIEIEGKSPTPRQIQYLIEEAKEQGARVIFVSPQFDSKSAGVIAKAIGGSVVQVDPLGKNVLDNLEKIAIELQTSLKQQTGRLK